MVIPLFTISTLPRIVFGEGSVAKVPELAHEFGQCALLVVGCNSFERHTALPVVVEK